VQAVYSASCRREGQGELVETSVTFPGRPAIVPSARRFVRRILDDSPRADDMELIARELISNAILHSPAGEPGGEFTVTIRTGSCWARIEVSDAGTGEWYPLLGCPRDDDEYGRGMAIIAALADKFGHDATPAGQVVWAEVSWLEAREGSVRLDCPRRSC
jgi:anti-sigma regulatory factor (Ser/Thr protein kinase)